MTSSSNKVDKQDNIGKIKQTHTQTETETERQRETERER